MPACPRLRLHRLHLRTVRITHRVAGGFRTGLSEQVVRRGRYHRRPGLDGKGPSANRGPTARPAAIAADHRERADQPGHDVHGAARSVSCIGNREKTRDGAGGVRRRCGRRRSGHGADPASMRSKFGEVLFDPDLPLRGHPTSKGRRLRENAVVGRSGPGRLRRQTRSDRTQSRTCSSTSRPVLAAAEPRATTQGRLACSVHGISGRAHRRRWKRWCARPAARSNVCACATQASPAPEVVAGRGRSARFVAAAVRNHQVEMTCRCRSQRVRQCQTPGGRTPPSGTVKPPRCRDAIAYGFGHVQLHNRHRVGARTSAHADERSCHFAHISTESSYWDCRVAETVARQRPTFLGI